MHCVAKSFKFGKKEIMGSLVSTLNRSGHTCLNESQFQNVEEMTSENECCCLLLISGVAE